MFSKYAQNDVRKEDARCSTKELEDIFMLGILGIDWCEWNRNGRKINNLLFFHPNKNLLYHPKQKFYESFLNNQKPNQIKHIDNKSIKYQSNKSHNTIGVEDFGDENGLKDGD